MKIVTQSLKLTKMSKSNYYNRINSQIDKHCEKFITHLTIDFDKQDKGWYWRYMAIDSRLKDLYFQSPIEALVNFAAYIAEDIHFIDNE